MPDLPTIDERLWTLRPPLPFDPEQRPMVSLGPFPDDYVQVVPLERAERAERLVAAAAAAPPSVREVELMVEVDGHVRVRREVAEELRRLATVEGKHQPPNEGVTRQWLEGLAARLEEPQGG